MALNPSRSIKVPITLAAVTVALSIAMLVGWIVVIAGDLEVAEGLGWDTFLLVAGVVSLVAIITGLVLFSVFLVREILEGRRQVGFIDSVTHELKSPLASLKLCVQTLARGGLPEDQRSELQRMMLDDIDRLNGFIDDVLAASRLAHGPGQQSFDAVPLADLAMACAARVGDRYHTPEGAIRVRVDPSIVVVTDRTALETVLKNLLDNAVKYSGEVVDVEVRATGGAAGVDVEVRDRGIGIPPKYLKRVFDRFYRVPREAVNARRGTGLGLYVASSLVRHLGGRLRAESPGEGRGTVMAFRLPVGQSMIAENLAEVG